MYNQIFRRNFLRSYVLYLFNYTWTYGIVNMWLFHMIGVLYLYIFIYFNPFVSSFMQTTSILPTLDRIFFILGKISASERSCIRQLTFSQQCRSNVLTLRYYVSLFKTAQLYILLNTWKTLLASLGIINKPSIIFSM